VRLVTPKEAGGNVTTHALHRIIYFCIIYAISYITDAVDVTG